MLYLKSLTAPSLRVTGRKRASVPLFAIYVQHTRGDYARLSRSFGICIFPFHGRGLRFYTERTIVGVRHNPSFVLPALGGYPLSSETPTWRLEIMRSVFDRARCIERCGINSTAILLQGAPSQMSSVHLPRGLGRHRWSGPLNVSLLLREEMVRTAPRARDFGGTQR